MSMAFAKPFNRTSMELKPEAHLRLDARVLTFNRTSMELKPDFASCHTPRKLEPVWN